MYRSLLDAAHSDEWQGGAGPVALLHGLAFTTAPGLEDFVAADTVAVPAVGRPESAELPTGLLAALREAHPRGARIASIGRSAFVLAGAGLLDGCRATTHWRCTNALAAFGPTCLWREYTNPAPAPRAGSKASPRCWPRGVAKLRTLDPLPQRTPAGVGEDVARVRADGGPSGAGATS